MLIKNGEVKGCGVYCIKTMQGKVLYVGGTKNLGDAYSRHKANLVNGSYAETNKHLLQIAFNTEDLIFTVLENCSPEDQDKIETKYIKMYKDTLLNRDKVGKHRKNKSTPEETKKRRNANTGENNPHNTKLTKEIVFEILDMINSGTDRKTIEKKYNLCKGYTSRIGYDRWLNAYNAWKKEKEASIPVSINTSTCTSANVQ